MRNGNYTTDEMLRRFMPGEESDFSSLANDEDITATVVNRAAIPSRLVRRDDGTVHQFSVNRRNVHRVAIFIQIVYGIANRLIHPESGSWHNGDI